MIKSWAVLFKDIIIDRIIELHEKLLPDDREYLRLEEEYSRVMEELIKYLSPTKYKLFWISKVPRII